MAAVQIFNNPLIKFKSELFIVTMIISWTYFLHAYYRGIGIEYRYYDLHGTRKRFHKTKRGAFKYWELERCLQCTDCPLDTHTNNNLMFLIGLRHEIEHQMTNRIDSVLIPYFQACCVNYNQYIKTIFGEKYAIDKKFNIALQFFSLTTDQTNNLHKSTTMPGNIRAYLNSFFDKLSDDERTSQLFSYKVIFEPTLVNNPNRADKIISFVKPDPSEELLIEPDIAVIKEVEKRKYSAKEIVEIMRGEGFFKFNMRHFVNLWKEKDAKNPGKGYGAMVVKQWYWYDSWVGVVREHCLRNSIKYKEWTEQGTLPLSY